MTAWGKVLVAVGVVAACAVVVMALKDQITELVLARGLPPRARKYAGFIVVSAVRNGLDPWKLAGLISRESDFGAYLTPKGPAGTGDEGHGHGLAQVDDRTWGAWLAANDWRDPAVNIEKGAQILAAELKTFGGDYGKALAAYNAGPRNVARALARGAHPDSVTTGKDYGGDVVARAAKFERASKGVV